jgi:hypothetical protein
MHDLLYDGDRCIPTARKGRRDSSLRFGMTQEEYAAFVCGRGNSGGRIFRLNGGEYILSGENGGEDLLENLRKRRRKL